MIRFAACLSVTLAGGASAQSVGPCDLKASARAIVEPWSEHSATYANGAVRLAVLDTVEPAAAAFHLLVLSPPYSELGERYCRVVSFEDGLGFTAVYFDEITAGYDPATGLTFALPVVTGDPTSLSTNNAVLQIVLNQSTGLMTTQLALGDE